MIRANKQKIKIETLSQKSENKNEMANIETEKLSEVKGEEIKVEEEKSFYLSYCND